MWFFLGNGKTELPEDKSEDLPDALLKMSLRDYGGWNQQRQNNMRAMCE